MDHSTKACIDPSFRAAFGILRRVSLRTMLQWPYWLIFGCLCFFLGGIPLVYLGLLFDVGMGDEFRRGSFVGWTLYMIVALGIVSALWPDLDRKEKNYDNKGPPMVGTYLFWLHAGAMLVSFLLHWPWWSLVAINMGAMALWFLAILIGVALAKRPLEFESLIIGLYSPCTEREMILQLFREDAFFWDVLRVEDKKKLWNSLPEWKWDLYYEAPDPHEWVRTIMADRIVELMSHEEHPNWGMVCSMYNNDIPKCISVFLDTRDFHEEIETYELPL